MENKLNRKRYYKTLIVFIFFVMTFGVGSCLWEQDEVPPVAPPPTDCDTSNVKYSTDIKINMDKDCKLCHNSDLFKGGVKLDTYEDTKSCALSGKLVESLNGSMEEYATNKTKYSCYILKIQAWINKGAPNN
jgi:hypothetical protein